MGYRVVKCKKCNGEIARSANVCHYCGARQHQVLYTLAALVLIAMFATIFFALQRGVDKTPPSGAPSTIGNSTGNSQAPSATTPETIQAPFSLTAGEYIVGEDMKHGKYDCVALSGAGTFQGGVFGVDTEYVKGYDKYNNLQLRDGDVVSITGNLTIEFSQK